MNGCLFDCVCVSSVCSAKFGEVLTPPLFKMQGLLRTCSPHLQLHHPLTLAMPYTLTPHIQRITGLTLALGECPTWDAKQQQLWCIDSRAGKIHSFNLLTKAIHTLAVPAPAGSFVLNHDGNLIVALKEEIALLQPTTGQLRTLAQLNISHPNLRFNDGAVMPDGSYVVGSMHIFRPEGEAPLGGLYRFTTMGQLQLIANDLAVVNGPCTSPVNQHLYVCDSAAKRIYSFAVDRNGALSDRAVFADTTELASAPDGCCFDSEGGLWTALVHAAALVRYDTAGKVTHRIELPVAHPASLCFGGANLDVLYVTTISDSGRLKAEGPLDGGILQLTGTGFRGTPRPLAQIRLLA